MTDQIALSDAEAVEQLNALLLCSAQGTRRALGLTLAITRLSTPPSEELVEAAREKVIENARYIHRGYALGRASMDLARALEELDRLRAAVLAAEGGTK